MFISTLVQIAGVAVVSVVLVNMINDYMSEGFGRLFLQIAVI